MRYICACPSCGFRLSRRYFISWQDPLRIECPGCHTALQSVRWLDHLWTYLLFLSFYVFLFFAGPGLLAWWWPVSAFFAGLGLGYLLFPYITKMTIDGQMKCRVKQSDITEWPPGL